MHATTTVLAIYFASTVVVVLLWDLVGFTGFCAVCVNKFKDTARISDGVVDIVFGVVEGVFE
jgi:hypothetical protein